MESLNYETLVSSLVEAVPEVPLDPDDVADNRAYIVFNDLLRYVISSLEAEGQSRLVARIFSFIEAAVRTKDVLILDVLEDALYQVAVAPTEKTASAKTYMGSTTKKLFRELEARIYQK